MFNNMVVFFLFILADNSCLTIQNTGNDQTSQTGQTQPHHTIWLVNHGWHTGLVLKRNEIADTIWPEIRDFSDSTYLETGWGDGDFYQAPVPSWWSMISAAIIPTDSVLHLVGFNRPVTSYFSSSEIIQLEITSNSFNRLVHAIASSFIRTKNGKAEPLGSGLYGNSYFYRSRESYHLFNTCNVWTARVLQTAGLPFNPAAAIRASDLMAQTRRINSTLRQCY